MCHLKRNDELSKLGFLMKLSFSIKSYGHLSAIWPILVDFAMTYHLLFSHHMIMVANFENFLFHLVSY